MDKIVAVLNCLRLRWQNTLGELNLLLFSKEYRLVLLESIREVLQVGLLHGVFHIVNESSSRRVKFRKTSEQIEKWELDSFTSVAS